MTKSLGRNSPCHCGSGKKYKNCCVEIDSEEKLKRLNESAVTVEGRLNYADQQKKIQDLIAEKNVGDNAANLDIILNGLLEERGFYDGEEEENSPEFNAITNWISQYSAMIDADHPFQAYLNDYRVSPQTLIIVAKKNGWSDYHEQASILYSKWLSS